jgi:dTDP-4-amino-4,6-dideoxygalactose transaminase
MQTPRIPVNRPYLPALAKYRRYVEDIFDRCWLTNNGPLVRELTERLEERLGVSNLLLVANGTLALQVAFKALDIGGSVVTSPFTFVATASALRWEGISPRFADVGPQSLTLDPVEAEKALDETVTGLVPIHVYGAPCEVEAIHALARRRKLRVVYDAAHAFGVEVGGKSVLQWGDASTLSFHATKLFHTAEGGAVVFKDADVLERASRMINFGIDVSDGSIVDSGINAKLSELQAAMGLAMLDDLPQIMERRLEIANLYNGELEDYVEMQVWPETATRNAAYVPILLRDEDECLRLKSELEAQGIEPRRYFHPPLARVPIYDAGAPTPIADSASRRVLCLPIFVGLDDQDVLEICTIVRTVVSEGRAGSRG